MSFKKDYQMSVYAAVNLFWCAIVTVFTFILYLVFEKECLINALTCTAAYLFIAAIIIRDDWKRQLMWYQFHQLRDKPDEA